MNAPVTNHPPVIRTKGQPPKIIYCDECGAPFWPNRKAQKFCSDKCRHQKNRRDQVKGAEIARLALEWRRHRKPGALPALTRQVDNFLREEKQRENDREAVIAEHKRQTGGAP